MQAILDRASLFLPDLPRVTMKGVDVRVGLRPCAPWGFPLIGAVPGTAGLFVAAGHEGSGLTLGPATGEIIADLVHGRHLPSALDGLVLLDIGLE
jgi:glycine/D-amino acid oxidase-like deaminating enzyme